MNFKEKLDLILDYASNEKLSDVHMNSNSPVRIRNHNWEIEIIEKINDNVIDNTSKTEIIEIIKIIVWSEWYDLFETNKELDTSYMIWNWDRYRVNCYVDSGWFSIAFRIIPNEIPTMEELGLWDQITYYHNWRPYRIFI